MNDTPSIEMVAARAAAFREMHRGPGMLVMPNAWDAASARTFEAAGFPAIATTSGGVAQSLGYEDHEGAPAEEMLAAAARITRAVAIPVTVDLEAGYGLSPAELMRRVVGLGAVGCNLEDSDHDHAGGVVPAEAQAERIAAARAEAQALGVGLVLNARVDVFIHRVGTPDEQLAEGIRRARLYREAGADCLYPIALQDEAMLAAFVEAVDLPVNINTRRNAGTSLARLSDIGVRRVTFATSLFRDVQHALDGLVAEIRGTLPSDAVGRGAR
jgi:2-methylisocitrate lyase-like PEP mutase family enzyme